MCNIVSHPISVQKFVLLPDGDRLSLEITTPPDWKPSDWTVFFVHGLCGSHKSPYLVRMTNALQARGIRVVRLNMRGCGSGKGHAKYPYHCGRSDDVFQALKVVKKEHSQSPILLIGFSMGANIVLKLAGEMGSLIHSFIERIIAISPPVEIFKSIQMLGTSCNRVYEKYFYQLLRNEVYYRHGKFKELPKIKLPRDLKIYEFDQLYTAPIGGFVSAMDYYDKASSAHLVGEITIPAKILFSEDDPIICHTSLDAYHLPSNIEVYKTKKGGHMGYLGTSEGKRCFYWLDTLILDWISESL